MSGGMAGNNPQVKRNKTLNFISNPTLIPHVFLSIFFFVMWYLRVKEMNRSQRYIFLPCSSSGYSMSGIAIPYRLVSRKYHITAKRRLQMDCDDSEERPWRLPIERAGKSENRYAFQGYHPGEKNEFTENRS
jgi:hypothetical protein